MTNLKEVPFIGANDYVGFAVLKVQPRIGKDNIYIQSPIEISPATSIDDGLCWLENVYTEQVISSLGMYGWNDVYSHLPPPHIEQLREEIAQRPFKTFMSRPLVLMDIGHWGAYINCGLGTRVAVAKMMGVERLPAFVLRTEVSGVVAATQEDFELLAQRKEERLWTGSLKKVNHEGMYAKGRVKWYTAPWVFARDMKKARIAYLLIGEEIR